MFYEVECNINTNVLIPTHRSWRHSLSASLEDRAHGGIRPRSCTNPRTIGRWRTATPTNQREVSVWLKTNRANRSAVFLYVGRWMTVWPMGCRDWAPWGRCRRGTPERAPALLQQESTLTDVPNDQWERRGADPREEEWQPCWSMSCESVTCDPFKLSRVSLWAAVSCEGAGVNRLIGFTYFLWFPQSCLLFYMLHIILYYTSNLTVNSIRDHVSVLEDK